MHALFQIRFGSQPSIIQQASGPGLGFIRSIASSCILLLVFSTTSIERFGIPLLKIFNTNFFECCIKTCCVFTKNPHFCDFLSCTLVAGSIVGPLFRSFFHQRDFNNEISSFALLDIQLTLFGVCEVELFIPELEHL